MQNNYKLNNLKANPCLILQSCSSGLQLSLAERTERERRRKKNPNSCPRPKIRTIHFLPSNHTEATQLGHPQATRFGPHPAYDYWRTSIRLKLTKHYVLNTQTLMCFEKHTVLIFREIIWCDYLWSSTSSVIHMDRKSRSYMSTRSGGDHFKQTRVKISLKLHEDSLEQRTRTPSCTSD